jgi:aconitate hydratase
MDVDIMADPLGQNRDGQPVYLRDIWPTTQEIETTIAQSIQSDMFRTNYEAVYTGDKRWNSLHVEPTRRYRWDGNSTYVRLPPYFEGMDRTTPETVPPIKNARVLALLGDSVTTDHISPAGNIMVNSPAGQYLIAQGVQPADFNSYGSRRGNHEVMMRGTFANVRLRNQLAPGTEGGVTTYLPTGEVMSIFDAAMKYQAGNIPLIILVGKEYGSGSSRDWAAKGPYLLGVRAVIAESYERIHRSNLIGMGILPLQFKTEESAVMLGLTGQERYEVVDLQMAVDDDFASGRDVTVCAYREDDACIEFVTTVRIDTPQEMAYFKHGGILQYVLRELLSGQDRPPVLSKGVSTAPDPGTGSVPS